jgi:hypothetical protein
MSHDLRKAGTSVAVQKSASVLPRFRHADFRPKPHQIDELLLSFDPEVRKEASRKEAATYESGHQP